MEIFKDLRILGFCFWRDFIDCMEWTLFNHSINLLLFSIN
jgi:hypothetical protein